MLCQTCHRAGSTWIVCDLCRRSLRSASNRILPGGVPVIIAFEHAGPARVLAHHLKYRGLVGYARLVAATLAGEVPPGPLVPVPRSLSRRLRYGTDPALLLATLLSRETGSPVYRLLRAPLHTPRRAGGDHRREVTIPGLRKRTLESVVLVDDVMTTGATLEAAVFAIGVEQVRAAVVANAVPDLTTRSLSRFGVSSETRRRTRI